MQVVMMEYGAEEEDEAGDNATQAHTGTTGNVPLLEGQQDGGFEPLPGSEQISFEEAKLRNRIAQYEQRLKIQEEEMIRMTKMLLKARKENPIAV